MIIPDDDYDDTAVVESLLHQTHLLLNPLTAKQSWLKIIIPDVDYDKSL